MPALAYKAMWRKREVALSPLCADSSWLKSKHIGGVAAAGGSDAQQETELNGFKSNGGAGAILP